MNSIRQLTLATLTLCATALTALAGDPNGTWKFEAEGPGGKSAESTLTLNWDNNQLTGQIDNRAGKADITKGKFADDQVSFTVVREIGRGFRKVKLNVRYTGKLEGDTIKGTIETTGREKKPVSIPWEAQRAK